MTANAKPARLGRGLSSLLGESSVDPIAGASGAERKLAIDLIEPNADQPRRRFAPEDLKDLTASIKAHGVLQPIIVRPHPKTEGRYQIVAGERRWRAAQAAGLHKLPAAIRDLEDAQVLEIALVENVQRADLNPIEEAAGYDALIKECQYTHEKLSEVIGKSRSHITNTMRLLTLPDAVRDLLENGRLSAGQARPLVGRDDAADLATEVVKKGLSARAVEGLVKRGPKKDTLNAPRPKKDADTRALEEKIHEELGLKVEIDHGGEGGRMTIAYKTLEDLDEICRRLCTRPGGAQAL